MPRVQQIGEGTRIARLFRQAKELLHTRRCDLEAICAEHEIEIVDADFGDGCYTASLQRCENNQCGLIALASGQVGGRRRFSIGHELGHFFIPKHSSFAGHCTEFDMRARPTDEQLREAEANEFAAELLMPWSLFAQDARKLEMSVASALALAAPERYDVSVMAAAWRMVETSRHAAAIVLSEDGYVRWFVKSDAFPHRLWDRGQQLHGHTLAASAFSSGQSNPRPLEVNPGCWLEEAVPGSTRLLESTHVIQSLDQVVSVLWLPELDREPGEFSDGDSNGES